MSERNEILQRIIAKGGLMGITAEMYINDEYLSNKFLIECYEQCHVKFVREFWGKQLINDVIIYNVRYNGKLMIDLM